MLVEFPFFAAGINYFPTEISVLKVFEPRYLLLIADAISSNSNFVVGKNLESKNQVISEVKILDFKDIENAEQIVVIECKKLFLINDINLNIEYPIAKCEEYLNIGIPPTEEEIQYLEKKIINKTAQLIEQGLDLNLPIFLDSYKSRINKIWDLCINSPLDFEIREKILNEKDTMKRFFILNNYIESL
ncbi:MAG: hypothetical protein O3A48_00430 [Actinomycetota bacterium]|nr:hypothetical protein [Actinomycetota bacterium]MDA3012994.1 hypothetical protein [Actinomycetota bacterium]